MSPHASDRARERANPHSRVMRMNESTSDDLEMVPLPARQQLGIFHPIVDVDARSGNGIADRVPMQDVAGANYQQPDPTTGGGGILEVDYHLERTPAPAEPVGAPGSASYNNNVLATPGAEGSDTVRIPTTGGIAAYQREGEPITTQREQPGRDARLSEVTGATDTSKQAEPVDLPTVTPTATASSAASTTAAPSDDAPSSAAPASDADEVPEGSMQVIVAWVGDDKARAQRALDAERGRPTPRNTLIAQLEEKLST